MNRHDTGTRNMAAIDEQALSALLEYIDRERDRRRKEILDTARMRADDLVRKGLQQARRRVHEAVENERRECRRRLQAERAAEESRLRRRRHELLRSWLDEAWECLEQEMAQRWMDADGRRMWVAMAVAEAGIHLPAGTWTLEHPRGTDLDGMEQVFASLAEDRPDVDVECTPDDELAAGVRLSIGHAVLDATAEALLERRSRVEGLLLGSLAREAGGSMAGAGGGS